MTFNAVRRATDNPMKAHAKNTAAKAVQRSSLLRMISGRGWGANQRTVLRLYKQYIRPVLEYGHVATAGAPVGDLERAERRALRIALRRPHYSRIDELYDESGIQPLADRLRVLKANAIQRFGQSQGIRDLEALRPALATLRTT